MYAQHGVWLNVFISLFYINTQFKSNETSKTYGSFILVVFQQMHHCQICLSLWTGSVRNFFFRLNNSEPSLEQIWIVLLTFSFHWGENGITSLFKLKMSLYLVSLLFEMLNYFKSSASVKLFQITFGRVAACVATQDNHPKTWSRDMIQRQDQETWSRHMIERHHAETWSGNIPDWSKVFPHGMPAS